MSIPKVEVQAPHTSGEINVEATDTQDVSADQEVVRVKKGGQNARVNLYDSAAWKRYAASKEFYDAPASDRVGLPPMSRRFNT
jgi:hypothetical protein